MWEPKLLSDRVICSANINHLSLVELVPNDTTLTYISWVELGKSEGISLLYFLQKGHEWRSVQISYGAILKEALPQCVLPKS